MGNAIPGARIHRYCLLLFPVRATNGIALLMGNAIPGARIHRYCLLLFPVPATNGIALLTCIFESLVVHTVCNIFL